MNIYVSMAILYLLLINTFENALIFSICFIITMLISDLIISLLKDIIPTNYRIVVSLIVTSSIITLIELLLKKYIPLFYNDINVYLPLMMLILYDFNSKKDLLSNLGNTLNKAFRYSMILIGVILIKEIICNGSITIINSLTNLLGFSLIIKIPTNNLIPLNNPGISFILVGLVLAIITKYRRSHA